MGIATGAGRGIGRAPAELLASSGTMVVLAARIRAQLDSTERGIKNNGGMAHSLAGDLTDDGFVSSLFSVVERECGRLDFLVNNAGIAPFGGVEELHVSQSRQCLEIYVVAVFACTQASLRCAP